ncbi:MAG TPA: hypothetical protein VF790_08805 [Dissulfurispiraceae bacterium]
MERKSLLKRILSSLLILIAAAWIMAEEWIWDRIISLMRRVSHLPFVAAVEARIARLNPYLALTLFVVPLVFLLPVKLYAAYLIAKGAFLRGTLFIIVAKTVSTAVITKLYLLCKPQLMTVGLFERGYHWVIAARNYIHERLEELGVWQRAKAMARDLKVRIRRYKERYFGGQSLLSRIRSMKVRLKRKAGRGVS